MRKRLRLTIATTVSVCACLALAASASAAYTTEYKTIPGTGGTALKALVITPTGTPGPHPLLVMPSSWSMPNMEYLGAAWKLAYDSGYEVISYTSRGFWDSEGGIDVAGPDTVGDVSRMIDWAVANDNADASRVATVGISYGAGVGLLASATDPRIKAVVAMSGWTDLKASLYANDTISKQGIDLLLTAGKLTGRFSPELTYIDQQYRLGNIQPALDMAPSRSAQTVLGQTNANGAAIMIANSWEDGLFPPSQLVPYYNGLTGAKRLMIGPGDHATGELSGAIGLDNDRWTAATRWLNHYLKGEANGVETEKPVQLQGNNGGGWRGFGSWTAASPSSQTKYLTRPSGLLTPTGGLSGSSNSGWSYKINAGNDTIADSGIVMITGMLQGTFQLPPLAPIPLIDRGKAAVWQSGYYTSAKTISGAPHVRFTVTPSAANSSLFVYLYDVDALGLGGLITHKPYTLRGATPGVARTLDFDLEPTVWNVAFGHRLAVVVDTIDPRYTSESKTGTTVSFGSPSGSPSLLRVPTL